MKRNGSGSICLLVTCGKKGSRVLCLGVDPFLGALALSRIGEYHHGPWLPGNQSSPVIQVQVPPAFHWSWNCLYLSRRVTARGTKEPRGPSELHWDLRANDSRTSREVKWPPQALSRSGRTTRTDSLNHQYRCFAAAAEKQICWCFRDWCYMTLWSWCTTDCVSY